MCVMMFQASFVAWRTRSVKLALAPLLAASTTCFSAKRRSLSYEFFSYVSSFKRLRRVSAYIYSATEYHLSLVYGMFNRFAPGRSKESEFVQHFREYLDISAVFWSRASLASLAQSSLCISNSASSLVLAFQLLIYSKQLLILPSLSLSPEVVICSIYWTESNISSLLSSSVISSYSTFTSFFSPPFLPFAGFLGLSFFFSCFFLPPVATAPPFLAAYWFTIFLVC